MIESTMSQQLHDPVHEPGPGPTAPPEWTPPGWAPPVPTAPPQRPDRAPSLPMILTAEPGRDDVMAQLLRRRVVLLTGRLDRALADDVTARLLVLDKESSDAITLHISVPTAELDPAISLVAAIDLISADVTAIASGAVEGAAVAVYAAAAHRWAHPHAQFVLREPPADLRGDADRLQVAAEQHRRAVESVRDRIARVTGRDSDDVRRDMEQGRLLTADEAVAYGLVQELTAR